MTLMQTSGISHSIRSNNIVDVYMKYLRDKIDIAGKRNCSIPFVALDTS